MNKMRSIWIGLACCGFLWGADWLTDGGNQKRTGLAARRACPEQGQRAGPEDSVEDSAR